MIKRLITVALFSALAAIQAAAQAQPNRFPPINLVPGDPTGTPCAVHAMVQSSDSGLLYTCQGGVFHGSSPVDPARVSWPPECNAPGMVYNVATNTCTDVSHVPPASVAWPPSCTSGTYVPASNSCVPTGTAANPGGAPGQTQINAGGSTFIGIPGSMTDAVNGWKTQGGINYAKGWQSGAGNNGIGNAAVANQTVIADPSYGFTEKPGPLSFAASPMAYIDQRNGQTTNFYHNVAQANFIFGVYPLNSTSQNLSTNNYCQFDQQTLSRPVCEATGLQVNSPGWSISNSFGGGAAAGWAVHTARSMVTQVRSAGISESLYINQNKYGIGDNFVAYLFNTNQGGRTAPNDESSGALGMHTEEDLNYYQSTCVTGCTPASTQIKAALGSAGTQGVGRYLIDTTQAPVIGNVTGIATGLGGGQAWTIDQTVTPSTAWGTITVVNTPNNLVYPYTTTETVTVTLLNGGAAFVPGVLTCFTGAYHEQAIPTSVGAATATQTVTFATPTSGLRRPHYANSYLFQGGMCGRGLEMTYYTQTGVAVTGTTSNGSATVTAVSSSVLVAATVGQGITGANIPLGTTVTAVNSGASTLTMSQPATASGSAVAISVGGLKYLFDVVGSTGPNTLQVGAWTLGVYGSTTITNAGLSSFTLTNATASTGTTVSLVYSAGNLGGLAPWKFPGVSLQLSGSSDSALNTICTNAQWLPPTTYTPGNSYATCTIAGLTGTHTTTSSMNAVLAGLSAVNIWPMAEVVDVQNYNDTACLTTGTTATPVHAPCVDGTFLLEPNTIQFAANDAIQEVHHTANQIKGISLTTYPKNPYALLSPLAITSLGAGVVGGGASSGNNALIALNNLNNSNTYAGQGGPYLPPNAMNATGAYYEGLMFNEGPSGDALIWAKTSAAQQNNPNYSYNALWAGNTQLQIVPYNNNAALTTPGALVLQGTPIITNGAPFGPTTFNGPVTIASPAPVMGTITGRPYGGALADGSYCYQVQVRGATINAAATYSPISAEACGTVSGGGGNGSVLVTWKPVAMATTGYQVFGRTTGTELKMFFLNINTIYMGPNGWVDDGSVTPTGGANAVTAPGIETAAYVGLLSSGTANELKLQAPAGMAATATLTVTKINTVSITPTAVTASTCAEQTFSTYTGLIAGQSVTVNPPTFIGAHVWIGAARVAVANQLIIDFCADATGGTPISGIYTAMAF